MGLKRWFIVLAENQSSIFSACIVTLPSVTPIQRIRHHLLTQEGTRHACAAYIHAGKNTHTHKTNELSSLVYRVSFQKSQGYTEKPCLYKNKRTNKKCF